MLPVPSYPEPPEFDAKVRQPGRLFLDSNPPRPIDWKKKEYWRKILPDMGSMYNRICSYCSTWIKHSTGTHSIDHFLSKSKFPELAYEWSNYRYSSQRFNSRKLDKEVADPFTIGVNWFIIDFTTFRIKPNPDAQILDDTKRKLVCDTIKTLQFNIDQMLIDERVEFFDEYRKGEITFNHLKKQAPFIAYEIERQGLLNV